MSDNFAQQWTARRVGEIAAVNPDVIGADWPYPHIRYIDISSVGVGHLQGPPLWLEISQAPSRAKRLVRTGDTVLSTVRPNRRSMFFASQPGDDWVVSTGFAVLRPKTELVDPRFLYACVFNQAFTDYLVTREKGAAYPAVSPEDIANAEIALPPLKEQRAIACILGTLDDKIELNRKRCRTLEAMARAIFQSWFVDFDPVHHNARQRNTSSRRRQSSGPFVDCGENPSTRVDGSKEITRVDGSSAFRLSPELAALFPDRFEDSPLGPIPAGWRVRSLPEVFEVNPTRTLSKGTLAPYLDMANMPTQGPSPEAWVMRKMGSGMKFINGDTLVARITPCLENGKTAYVDFLAEGQVGWGSTEYIVLRPRGMIPRPFAYLLARTTDFRNFAIQQMTGSSGRQRVAADSLSKYMLVTPEPDDPLFVEFGKHITPMFQSMSAAMSQSRTLAALRDALLPKLISGELRVPDAERIVGRAL